MSPSPSAPSRGAYEAGRCPPMPWVARAASESATLTPWPPPDCRNSRRTSSSVTLRPVTLRRLLAMAVAKHVGASSLYPVTHSPQASSPAAERFGALAWRWRVRGLRRVLLIETRIGPPAPPPAPPLAAFLGAPPLPGWLVT